MAELDRKAQHLALARRDDIQHAGDSGLARILLRHRALPGRALANVELATEFLGASLRAPLAISAMTGGTDAARVINARLAAAAAEFGVAFALGSGRRLLDDPGLLDTYWDPEMRPRPPLVIANLGAAQVMGPSGAARAERVMTLQRADALFIHLNPLQEAVQPEGEPDFGGVVEAVTTVVEHLSPLPVAVKEVGFGMDVEDVRLLSQAGVAAIDVAGAGGTNWALIEGHRAPSAQAVAAAFANWGVSTARALLNARDAASADGLQLVGSGGLRDGVDAAKCLALGADVAGFARPMLLAASDDRAGDWLRTTIRQLQIATWLTGVASVNDLDLTALQRPPVHPLV
jgi:isopentenyl-diphosphate delta-isomerase